MFIKMLELEGVFIEKEDLLLPSNGQRNNIDDEIDPKNDRIKEMGDLANYQSENQKNAEFSENSDFTSFQKKPSPDAGLDIFKLKILTLLICRGEPKVKAGLLFDLVYRGREIPEKVIIWSNSKLKEAFEHLFFFSEIMPKMFYLKFQTQNDMEQKLDLEIAQLNSKNAKDGYRSAGKTPVQ